jgi:hypothetical protein
MSFEKLKDEEVFAFIGRSSKSIILEVISDDPESLELTYQLFMKVLEDCGLKWRDID